MLDDRVPMNMNGQSTNAPHGMALVDEVELLTIAGDAALITIITCSHPHHLRKAAETSATASLDAPSV